MVQGIEDRSGLWVRPGPGGGTHRLSGWSGNPLDLFTWATWSTPSGENIKHISNLSIYKILGRDKIKKKNAIT